MSVNEVYPPIVEGGLSGGHCSARCNALMNYKILYVQGRLSLFSVSLKFNRNHLSPPNIMKEVYLVLMAFYFIGFILVKVT